MTITLPTASFWIKYLHPEIVRLAKPVVGWFYTISANGDLSVSLPALIILGLFIGLLAGSFGVGSGFLMTPFLNLVGGIPYNVAIGSDVAHMVGSATISQLRQRGMGYVDFKLGLLLFVGSVIGVEIGVFLLQLLKFAGEFPFFGHQLSLMQLVMTILFALLLGWIGLMMYRETRASLRMEAGIMAPEEPMAMAGSRLQTINLPPMISLPVSGVETISLWLIIGVGLASGLLTGFLGVSGAFIRMPAMIYVLGVPTVVSIGTNLFELLILALYAAFAHSLVGNVDLTLVIILLITTTIGNQIGVLLQKRLVGPRSLQVYVIVIFVTILLMILKFFFG
jgi:uncharacterized membrane protein YfcA